jgi:hypothetical protein
MSLTTAITFPKLNSEVPMLLQCHYRMLLLGGGREEENMDTQTTGCMMQAITAYQLWYSLATNAAFYTHEIRNFI